MNFVTVFKRIQFSPHHFHIGFSVFAENLDWDTVEFIIVFAEGQFDAIQAALAENSCPTCSRANRTDADFIQCHRIARYDTDKKQNCSDR